MSMANQLRLSKGKFRRKSLMLFFMSVRILLFILVIDENGFSRSTFITSTI